MKNIFNHKELEDEEVNCLINGNGYITHVQGDGCLLPYSVYICFIGNTRKRYTQDGRVLKSSCYPTLSFGHKEPKEHDYGESKLSMLIKSITYKQKKKKKLNFKKWLKKQGVSSTKFLDNLNCSLKDLLERGSRNWVSTQCIWFMPDKELIFWYHLQSKWHKSLSKAEKHNIPVVFGFKKHLKER